MLGLREARLIANRFDELFCAAEDANEQEAQLLLVVVIAAGGVAQVLAMHLSMITPKEPLVCTASVPLELWPTGVLAFRLAGAPAA